MKSDKKSKSSSKIKKLKTSSLNRILKTANRWFSLQLRTLITYQIPTTTPNLWLLKLQNWHKTTPIRFRLQIPELIKLRRAKKMEISLKMAFSPVFMAKNFNLETKLTLAIPKSIWDSRKCIRTKPVFLSCLRCNKGKPGILKAIYPRKVEKWHKSCMSKAIQSKKRDQEVLSHSRRNR